MQSLVSFSQRSQQGEVESHAEELVQTNHDSPRTQSSAIQSPSELLKLHQCLSSEGQITVPSISHHSEAGTGSHSHLKNNNNPVVIFNLSSIYHEFVPDKNY